MPDSLEAERTFAGDPNPPARSETKIYRIKARPELEEAALGGDVVAAAELVSQETGFPKEILLRAAALESGKDYASGLARQSNNLFGMKTTATHEAAGGMAAEHTTTEYKDGVAGKVKAEFKTYNNVVESMQDYVDTVTHLPRYRAAAEAAFAGDVAGYFDLLQKGGYATDPNYARLALSTSPTGLDADSSSTARPSDVDSPTAADAPQRTYLNVPAAPLPPIPSRGSFRVTARGSLLLRTEEGELTHLRDGIDTTAKRDLLDEVGRYNDVARVWEIPASAAKELMNDRLPLPDYLKAKFKAGEIPLIRGLLGAQYLRGKLDLQSAREQSSEALLKMQLDEAPILAWNKEGFAATAKDAWRAAKAAGVSGVLRRASGESAQLLPLILSSTREAAEGAAVAGGGVMAMAGAAGVLNAPGAAAMVATAMSAGSTAGVYLHLIDVEAGNFALEMTEKGADEDTVKKLAPLVGILSGGLDVVGFKYFTAPFKRKALAMLAEGPVSKALSSWYANYAKELGVEITTELAQDSVSLAAQKMSALIDENPNLDVSNEEVLSQMLATAAAVGAGMPLLKVPGVMLDVMAKEIPDSAKGPATAAEEVVEEAPEPVVEEAPVAEPEPAPVFTAMDQETATEQMPTLVQEFEQGQVTAEELILAANAASGVTAEEAAEASIVAGEAKLDPRLEGTKAVDADGSPILVYHGSREKGVAETLSPDSAMEVEGAVFFTTNEDVAYQYTFEREYGEMVGDQIGEVVPARLRMVNPKIVDAGGQTIDAIAMAKIIREAKAEGRDGVIFKNIDDTVDSSKTLGDTYAVFSADQIVTGEAAEPPTPPPAPPLPDESGDAESRATIPLEEKVRDVELQGRINFLEKELNAAEVEAADKLAAVAPLEQEVYAREADVAAREQSGKKTKTAKAELAVLRAKLNTAQAELVAADTKVEEFREELERLKAGGLGTVVEDLPGRTPFEDAARVEGERAGGTAEILIKAAKLEDIVAEGFRAGRAEVTRARVARVREIGEALGLTIGDLRKIMKGRETGVMSDKGFDSFMERFKAQAEVYAERKQALQDLREIQKDRAVKFERRILALHGLPNAKKMTVAQLQDYAEILAGYEQGAIPLTPKRIAALWKSPGFEGVLTAQDVTRIAEEQLKLTPESVLQAARGVKGLGADIPAAAKPEMLLERAHPFFKFLVAMFKVKQLEAQTKTGVLKSANRKLAAAAIASRAKISPFKRRFADWFALQQAELKTYLDAGSPAARSEAAAKLTPEEITYAEFLRETYMQFFQELLAAEALGTSRFVGAYSPSFKRDMAEIVRGFFEGDKLKDTVAEVFAANERSPFNMFDASGRPIAFESFLSNTLYRTGTRRPSLNMVEAVEKYANKVYFKQAVDATVPVFDSITYAYAAIKGGSKDKVIADELVDFVREWLSAKKGNAAVWKEQGTWVETAVTTLSNLSAIRFLAGNLAVIGTSPVGANISEIMEIGAKQFVLVQRKKRTAQGKAILAKLYGNAIPEPWIKEVTRPGASFPERVSMLLRGVHYSTYVGVLEDVIIANATEEEFAAGEMSVAHVAEILRHANRWIDVHGAKSIIGSSEFGKAYMQYKSWGVPPAVTIFTDVKDFLTPGKKLTRDQQIDFFRLAYMSVITGTAMGVLAARNSGEDDTFEAKLVKKLIAELNSNWGAIGMLTAAGAFGFGAWTWLPIAAFASMWQLVTLAREKRTGDLKAPKTIGRAVTPVLIGQFMGSGKKKQDLRKGH